MRNYINKEGASKWKLQLFLKELLFTITLSDEHVDYLWATKEQMKALLPHHILKDFEKNHIFELGELI